MEIEAQIKPDEEFYADAAHYWRKIPATVDGMLGGFGFISHTDIQGSKAFLHKLFRLPDPPEHGRALDCGAGIGRITKNLLEKNFSTIDLVEQNPDFLAQAKAFVGSQKLGELFAVGLQDFRPTCSSVYDLIWCQWVMGHLKDEHFVTFLETCKKSLNKNGVIVVKENITSSGNVEIDEQDSSVTRPVSLFRMLFKKANLQIIRETKQPNFPRGLYSVYMFALRPSSEEISVKSC